jgi:hypothetical protein
MKESGSMHVLFLVQRWIQREVGGPTYDNPFPFLQYSENYDKGSGTLPHPWKPKLMVEHLIFPTFFKNCWICHYGTNQELCDITCTACKSMILNANTLAINFNTT